MIRETTQVAPVRRCRKPAPGKGLSELRWGALPGNNPGAQNWSQERRARAEGERAAHQRVGADPPSQGAKDCFGKMTPKTSVSTFWQQSRRAALSAAPWKDDTPSPDDDGRGRREPRLLRLRAGQEDGRYVGFSYGKRTSLIMDSSLLTSRSPPRPTSMPPCGRGNLARQSRRRPAGAHPTTTVTTWHWWRYCPAPSDSGKADARRERAPRRAIGREAVLRRHRVRPAPGGRCCSPTWSTRLSSSSPCARREGESPLLIEIQAESATGFDDGLRQCGEGGPQQCCQFKNAGVRGGGNGAGRRDSPASDPGAPKKKAQPRPTVPGRLLMSRHSSVGAAPLRFAHRT